MLEQYPKAMNTNFQRGIIALFVLTHLHDLGQNLDVLYSRHFVTMFWPKTVIWVHSIVVLGVFYLQNIFSVVYLFNDQYTKALVFQYF